MTRIARSFDPKRSGETVTLAWDFKHLLGTGETLSTAANWVATVHQGTDASPSAIISGSASISGTKSVQKVTGGLDGVVYCLKIEVGTSAGQTLIERVRIEVDDDC